MEEIVTPIIVLYNKECEQSPSLMSIVKQGFKPIVVDNSTRETNNADFCSLHGISYIKMNGNEGLSRAYNRALDSIDYEKEGYVLLLDDDTVIPNDTLESAARYLEAAEYRVYVPVVKSIKPGMKLVSPCVDKGRKMKRVATCQDLDGHRISAINSGMFVNKKVYKNYRYDEGLFLDCIDHDFIFYCYNHDIGIKIMKDVVIEQAFSGDVVTDRKKNWQRYKIFYKDCLRYRNKTNRSKIFTYYILARRLVGIIIG